MAGADAFYWVPHPEEVWLPGRSQGDNKYETTSGEVTVTDDKRGMEISDNAELEGVDDCCSLVNVAPASILHTTRVRYQRGDIYTNVSNVLIAVNPFKALQIYSQDYVEKYRTASDRSTLAPHIFGICAEAFAGLYTDNSAQQDSQAVLISGESGAGKTETTKLVLLYTSEMLSGQEGGLEDLLMEINPILEAFGNAKTSRNNNSSRFGKWIEVCVDPAARTLRGVSVVDYLLEVTRICGQGPGERNYHIFYQLAADATVCEQLKLQDAAKSNYLKTNPMVIKGLDDTVEFAALRKALTTLNFDEDQERELFQVCGAILHIGNFAFSKDAETKITNPDVLKVAAELLEVEAEALQKCICMTRRVAGKDTVFSPNDAAKATSAKDSMAKMVYGLMFKWIVARCNKALGEGLGEGGGGGDVSGPFMGVLDIAGFESFEKNLLEQLLINLSNEKLQQFFNNKVFKSELAEYKEEEIDVADIKFSDNVEVLNLIEGAGGILAMLDDSTNGVKQTDALLCQNLHKEKASHANFLKPKKHDPLMFGVRHYAGDVFYVATDFLTKNSSTKPPEIVELLQNSKTELLPELVEDEAPAASGGKAPAKGGGKKATVAGIYKKSLGQLMEKLKTANCHFARCIKPNAQKVPDIFTAAMVMDQLRLCGVMETVEIRKAGYLVRSKYAEFCQRYLIIVGKEERRALKAAGDEKKSAGAIIKTLEFDAKQSALGKTKVFLKAQIYQGLEAARRVAFVPRSIVIQAAWRGYQTRKSMEEVKDVYTELKKIIEESGHKLREKTFQEKRVDRPTLAEDRLTTFDILLTRAVNLQPVLGYVSAATKLRADIAAEAQLARKLANLSLQLNVFEMEEALAQAKHYNMEGKLVQGVRKRLEDVQQEAPIKDALHAAVDMDDLEDLQKAVQDATDKGLDVLSAWTMPSGAAIMEKAVARMTELEEEKAKREAFLAQIRKEVEDHISSTDRKAVQETLARAAAAGVEGDEVDKLAQRCAKMEIDCAIEEKLQGCVMMNSMADIEAVIKMAEDQGIREPTWTLETGAALLKGAEDRLQELKAEKDAEQKARQAGFDKLGDDLKAAENSTDLEHLEDVLQRGTAAFSDASQFPEYAEILKEVSARVTTVQNESAIIKRIQNAMGDDDEAQWLAVRKEVEEAGLAESEDPWALKQGHSAFLELVAKIEAFEEKSEIVGKIKQAAEEFDISLLMKLIDNAVALGVPEDQYKAHNNLANKLQNTNHVRDLMNKHKANETIQTNLKTQLEELQAREVGSGSNIETKLRRLANSSNTEMMRTALREADKAGLKGDFVDEIRELCITLERQQPHLAKLQEVLWSGDLESLQAALQDFRDAEGEEGMRHPDQWPCEGLMDFFERACAKVEKLQSERPDTDDVEEKMHALKNSVDVAAIREGLKEAQRAKFTGPVLDEVNERLETLEAQKAYLMSIRHCVLFRDSAVVRRVLEEGIALGLDVPGNWLLDNGACSYALLGGYLKELEAKQKGDDAVASEVADQLRHLVNSTDMNEIRAALVKASANNVKSDLIPRLEERVRNLQIQTPILKGLKSVLRSTDAGAISAQIQIVRDAGLVNPRMWAWPEGPKVFSKVVQRKQWCEQVEDLESRIRKAMDIYNVRELEQCFKIGEYIGLPTNFFQEAKTLFLELQNPEHVDNLLTGLLAMKKTSTTGAVDEVADAAGGLAEAAITCLVNQSQYLGRKKDNRALQDVSERMAHTKTTQPTGKYYSASRARERLLDTVFEDIANYKNLRDPLTWPTEYVVSYDLETRTRAMVSFQAEKILQSLTYLRQAYERIATQNFLDLLRCMGDKPCAYTGDKQDPILKRLTLSRAVCDEIYLQVMKQLTNNASLESASKGWNLLQSMVQVALPSTEVYNFLLAFVGKEATPIEPERDPVKQGEKKSGWRQAFLDESKRLRQQQMAADGTLAEQGGLAQVAQMALSAKAGAKGDRKKSMARRKSRAALAEDRTGDIEKKRKVYAEKQVGMAQEVLRKMGTTPPQPYNPAAV